MLARNAEFFLRTDHALRVHAADLAALQFLGPRRLRVGIHQGGPGDRQNHLLAAVAYFQIGRPGNDLERFRRAIVHRDQHKPVRVGVRAHPYDPAHKDACAVPGLAHLLGRLHFQPAKCQTRGQHVHRHVQLHVVPQPAQGHSHVAHSS